MKTTGQLCRELNVKPYQVEYIIRNRLVPQPQKTDSGHRIFSNKDIKIIKEKLFEMSVK